MNKTVLFEDKLGPGIKNDNEINKIRVILAVQDLALMTAIYRIETYKKEHYSIWNDFVAGAKNATFLFHRDFMAYHSHRFEDLSLLVFKNDSLISVLPANIEGDVLHSHQGLSYGGFVFNAAIKFKDCLEAVKHSLSYCTAHGIAAVKLKLIPKIYHRIPADEIDYLLFLLDARLSRRDLSACVPMGRSHMAKNRMEGVKRGRKNGLEIREVNDLSGFWNGLLIPGLKRKYHKAPVHSLAEIRGLKQKFPDNIRQFNVYKDGDIVAGTTVFEAAQVAHAQYIASNPDKNTLGSLDLLHHHLITETFKHKKYFDFGISNENEGQHLNEGLLYWKQGYGNGMAVHDFYDIKPENYTKLNAIFI